MTFDEFLIEQTSRGEAWHAQAKTTGIEFARAAWDASAKAERERCATVCDDVSRMFATDSRDDGSPTADYCADKIRGEIRGRG